MPFWTDLGSCLRSTIDPSRTSDKYVYNSNNTIGLITVFQPTQPASDELLVFFPGTFTPCEDYEELLRVAGEQVRVICLAYDNTETIASVAKYSLWSRNVPDAFYDARLAAFNGSVSNQSGNNQQARLVAALQFLEIFDPGTSRGSWVRWISYLTDDRSTPRWPVIRLAGHSQGAGGAAFISYMVEVARVSQFAGVCDTSFWPSTTQRATPSERYYALASSFDSRICPTLAVQARSWRAEGAPSPTWFSLQNYSDGGLSPTLISTALPNGCDVCLPALLPNCACNDGSNASLSLLGHECVAQQKGFSSGPWQHVLGVNAPSGGGHTTVLPLWAEIAIGVGGAAIVAAGAVLWSVRRKRTRTASQRLLYASRTSSRGTQGGGGG